MLNNSIAFVGDPHVQFNNPANRVDNYFQSVIHKLKQVLDNNKYVISLGDTLSNPVLDIQGTMILIELLSNFKKQGGKFYEVLGNHVLYNWNLKTLNKTTIGLLHKLELIEILDRTGEIENSISQLEIGVYTIIPSLLTKPKDLIPAKQEHSIMVGHNYYNFNRDPKHSLEYDDLKELGYEYVFLGHDHEYYQPKMIENTWLYRPGSLGREAAHSYNFEREIIYYQLDLEDDKVRPIKLDHAPGTEVFSIEAVEKHENPTPTYVYNLEELMKSFKKKSSVSVSIKKLMEDNDEIPDRIVNFIESCYEACGIPFV